MSFSSELHATSVPIRIVENQDNAPTDASDAFVLDCIDGISTIEELSMFVAMSEEDLLQSLIRLRDQGLVRVEEMPADVHDASEFTELSNEIRGIRRPVSDTQITNPLDTRGHWPRDIDDESSETFRLGMPAATTAEEDTDRIKKLPPLPQRPLPSNAPQLPDTSDKIHKSGSSVFDQERDHSVSNRATPRRGLDTSWWKTVHEDDGRVSETHVTAHSTSGLRFPHGTTPPPAPVKPSAYEDKTGPVAVDRELVKGSVITGTAEPVAVDPSTSDIWGEEPIADGLKGELDHWTDDELRRVSYYLRLVETKTYYEIFDVEHDATTDEIMDAARRLHKLLALEDIRQHATEAGRMELSNLETSLDRAVEVLWDTKSRTRYDAALQALAALSSSNDDPDI